MLFDFVIDFFFGTTSRQKGLPGKTSGVEGARRIRYRGDRTGRAIPAPEANAEIQSNLDVRKKKNSSFFYLIHTL